MRNVVDLKKEEEGRKRKATRKVEGMQGRQGRYKTVVAAVRVVGVVVGIALNNQRDGPYGRRQSRIKIYERSEGRGERRMLSTPTG